MGLGSLRPVVLGPTNVPEVTDPTEAERAAELAVLSAVAHGEGPHGLAVIRAALAGLDRLDPEHAAVYFRIIYNALREPMRRAVREMLMERQTEGDTPYDQLVREFRGRAFRDGQIDGRIKGLRDALLRLLARAGIALTDEDRARIQACSDAETLDRWIENVLGAKTAPDVFS